MCGSPNTNHTGLHARNFWRRLAHIAKPVAPTRSRSVLNAILRSVTSCNGVSRRCRLDSKARCLCLRCLEVRPSIGFVAVELYVVRRHLFGRHRSKSELCTYLEG